MMGEVAYNETTIQTNNNLVNNNSTSNENNTTSQQQSVVQEIISLPVTAKNQIFEVENDELWVDVQSRCDAAGQKALNEKKANAYTCDVIVDENNIQIGYELKFK